MFNMRKRLKHCGKV